MLKSGDQVIHTIQQGEAREQTGTGVSETYKWSKADTAEEVFISLTLRKIKIQIKQIGQTESQTGKSGFHGFVGGRNGEDALSSFRRPPCSVKSYVVHKCWGRTQDLTGAIGER